MKTTKCFAMFLSSIGLFTLLTGCSTLGDKISGFGSSSPEKSGSSSKEEVYFTGSPDLPLYKSPGRDIIVRLPQYTKLSRKKLEKGYAYVRVNSTGVTGWVENSKLVWHLPKKGSVGAMEQGVKPPIAGQAPQPVTEAPAPQPPHSNDEAPSTAPAPVESAPADSSVAPSIFNPY